MPQLTRHRRWKEASRRADDAANEIHEMLQRSHQVPVAMQEALERLEREAAATFHELTLSLAPAQRPPSQSPNIGADPSKTRRTRHLLDR